MKNFLTTIKNKVQKSFSFKKISPHDHWKFLLYSFFIAVIILIIFSFYFLYKIKNKQIFQTAMKPEAQPVLLNEKLLNKITESFDFKLIKEKEIKDGLKFYKDPSI